MAACDAYDDIALVEPAPTEQVLLERELRPRYGDLAFEPVNRPCTSCSTALERSPLSGDRRMRMTASAAAQRLG